MRRGCAWESGAARTRNLFCICAFWYCTLATTEKPRLKVWGRARKVLCWPKICKMAHAFLWEYSYKRLKLAQLLGRLFR
jgi:hypothetical protein